MEPPSGTVTLLFAELEHAPGLEQRHGAAFVEAASEWRTSAARLIASVGGYEVKALTAGFMVAFADPGRAVRCAVEALEEAEALPWPGGVSPLRVGVNTGDPIMERDAATGRADYFGPVVNRAARLASAAHAGQALVSGTTRAAAGAAIDEAGIVDLGEHRLRGLDAPERIFQVLPAAWHARQFPPISAAASLPSNLPAQTSVFVGRDHELAALDALIASGARIVTITGPAGCGKSRLAVRLGSALMPRFEGGVWFSDLSEVREVVALAGAVAASFGLTLRPGSPAEEAVGELLEMRPPVLLVLDTFDHLLDHAAATVGSWAARAPRAVFLVTSRAATNLPAEREFRLEPLPAPGEIASGPGAAARAKSSEAVQLFVERAREARPDFELTDENAPDVARICVDLDGLPLAVELAAARVRVLSPAEMVRKLGQKFQLLRTTRQDAVRRQQTLSGAIEWSWDQLGGWERSAFLQASVFPGGFCEDAAAGVLDLSAHPGAPGPVAAASALLARSLLHAVDTPWGRRFSMYRPIREYAERKRAEARPEGSAAEERFATWCIRGGRRAWNFRRTAHEAEGKARLVAEMDNMLAAIDRDFNRASPFSLRRGALLLVSLGWIHDDIARRQDLISRGRDALRLLDVAAPEPGDRVIRGELHLMLGHALWGGGDRDAAIPNFDRALAIAEQAGDDSLLARARHGRGLPAFGLGEYQQALDLFAAAITPFEAMGDEAGVGLARNARGTMFIWRGEPRAALQQFDLALRHFSTTGFAYGTAMVKGNSGLAYKSIGENRQAEAVYRESIAFSENAGYNSLLTTGLGNLAGLLSDLGRYEEALAIFGRAGDLDRRLGDRRAATHCRANCGVVYMRQGRTAEALACFEEIDRDFRLMKDPATISTNLSNMAAANTYLGHPDRAIKLYEEARLLELGSGDRLGASMTDFSISSILFDLGRFTEAVSRLRPALEVQRELGVDGAILFTVHLGIYALALEGLGRREEALVAARDSAARMRSQTLKDSPDGRKELDLMDRVKILAGDVP